MSLDRLAIGLRALQLYGQHAHNNCTGKSFIPDHDLFAASYEAAAADYDAVVERMIGTTNEMLDTLALLPEALKLASQCSREAGDCNIEFVRGILKLELAICIYIDKTCAAGELPEGTKQLIGDIADRSMSRQYKLRQRLK